MISGANGIEFLIVLALFPRCKSSLDIPNLLLVAERMDI